MDHGSADQPPAALTAELVRQWLRCAARTVERHRADIDALNVYPVPDSDTGTNLTATLSAAGSAVDDDATLPEVIAAAARAALLSARGNSGAITAQLLTGLARSWRDDDTVDAAGLADGLADGARAAGEAVTTPVDGTMVTVAAAAARAAAAHRDAPLPVVCRAVSDAASSALAATVTQLPALTRAGVVDAGGYGLALMLDCLAATVTGETVNTAERTVAAGRTEPTRPSAPVPRETGSARFGYEVQYLVDAEAAAVERLRAVLAGLGDSLVVVGSAGDTASTWNIHVHVNDIAAAVQAGIDTGRVHRLSISRFDDTDRAAEPSGRTDDPVRPDRGVVVVAPGDRFAALLRAEGAIPVSAADPSASDLGTALTAVDAVDLILLVDNALRAVAERAAENVRVVGRRVAVIPTRSPVQALAALAVRDPRRRFDDEVIALAEAAAACRHGELTVAPRAGLTTVGPCRAGDYLGLADGDVIVLGPDLSGVLHGLVDRLCAAGAELLTVVGGAELSGDRLTDVADHVARRWPLVEVQCFAGGQPGQLAWIGAE